MTPEDIEDLFKRTEGVVLPEDGDEDEAVLTDEEKSYRIAHLRAVLLEAHNAWVSGSDDLDRIAEKLGDGSRHGESTHKSHQPACASGWASRHSNTHTYTHIHTHKPLSELASDHQE